VEQGSYFRAKAPPQTSRDLVNTLRLELAKAVRDLAPFDLAIDSKLRGCDLVKLQVNDVMHGNTMLTRTMVVQQKTKQPVRFEITQRTQDALKAWITEANLRGTDFIFQSRLHASQHLSTRQYARIVKTWVESIGLDSAEYGTYTMRRTKASLIYKKTKNIRAVQLLLGHTKLEFLAHY